MYQTEPRARVFRLLDATALGSQDTVNVLPSADADPGVAPAFEALSGAPKNESSPHELIGNAVHVASLSVPGWPFAMAAMCENATVPKFASGRTSHGLHSEGASAIHSADETSGSPPSGAS